MAGSITNSSANSVNTNPNNEQEVDVLYQKLGNQWFAFSIVDDEVFMSPVSQDQINEIRAQSATSPALEKVVAASFEHTPNHGANHEAA